MPSKAHGEGSENAFFIGHGLERESPTSWMTAMPSERLLVRHSVENASDCE